MEQHVVTLVRHPTSPALAGLVAGMVGLSERAPAVVRRRQPAGPVVPLVLSFGEPLTIEALTDGAGAGRAYDSFVAGLSTGHADTSFRGGQDSVQVYLTPVGVRRILGVPGVELARSVRRAADFGPDLGDSMSDRLHGEPDWGERFRLVEQVLLLRAGASEPAPAWVEGVWHRIERSRGRVRVSELVAATGWSHRYVSAAFRSETGLTMKEAAGLVRFDRAAAALGTAPQADIALRHGFADQSHFAREVRRYAGETPGELLAARRPTPATALGHHPSSTGVPGPADDAPASTPRGPTRRRVR